MKVVLTADTSALRQIGLRGTQVLPEHGVALFKYDEPSTNSFWNKGVYYPIDIGFYNKNKQLIFKTSMEANQYQTVSSPEPYWYVVETNKGMLDINDLTEIL